MKKLVLPLAFALFTSVATFTGCRSSSEKIENAEGNVEDAQAKLDQARKDSADEYEKSKADWTVRIAKNDQMIADYKIKVAKENKAQREKDEARLAELEKRNEAMKANMNEYKHGKENYWADFKAGFIKMTNDFDQDMTEFGNSLGKVIDGK